ncbi:MAG: hypothetical protein IJY74_03790 [Oscillospiraceae bacterium]|nr:hypothetical protein [Oscillospiraceae bacterium]
MKKSVYSIVLTDSVVNAIDQLAMRQGTSRSNLIDQILAEHACCKTPEMEMQSVFSVMEKQVNELFRIQTQASDAMMSMHSALKYKYRPSLRYSVELMRQPDEKQCGWLRVSCRTQNSTLLEAMEDFFRLWIQFELRVEPEIRSIAGMYELAPGKMTRRILRRNISPEETGKAISMYITRFDEIMQAYFSGLQSGIPPVQLRKNAAEMFSQFYRQHRLLI